MTKTRKEPVSPDIMALIKAASHRFRDALSKLGKENWDTGDESGKESPERVGQGDGKQERTR